MIASLGMSRNYYNMFWYASRFTINAKYLGVKERQVKTAAADANTNYHLLC